MIYTADMDLRIRKASLGKKADARILMELMGEFYKLTEGKEYPDNIAKELPGKLFKFKYAIVYFMLADEIAVGFAICLRGFSTYLCNEILNIHDIYIREEQRNLGIGTYFLQQIEQLSRRKYKRITLEVESENHNALHVYEKLGYTGSDTLGGNKIYYAMYKNL